MGRGFLAIRVGSRDNRGAQSRCGVALWPDGLEGHCLPMLGWGREATRALQTSLLPLADVLLNFRCSTNSYRKRHESSMFTRGSAVPGSIQPPSCKRVLASTRPPSREPGRAAGSAIAGTGWLTHQGPYKALGEVGMVRTKASLSKPLQRLQSLRTLLAEYPHGNVLCSPGRRHVLVPQLSVPPRIV